MKLLALDTSTLVATVAAVDGKRLLAQRERRVTTHSEGLLALIDEVLFAATLRLVDVDAIACGTGPGSFTGLRIGMATAKGLCFGRGIPLRAVSSLAALALDGAAAAHGALILALLDAKKSELYAGLYRPTADLVTAVAAEVVLPPEQLFAYVARHANGERVVVVGDGAVAYRGHAEALGCLPTCRGTPSAESVARLALATSGHPVRDALATAAPTYIRPSEAELKLRP